MIDPKILGECATWLSIVSQLYGTHMTKLLEPHGLTPSQFNILHHLARPGMEQGTRISDIAASVEVNQPAVTKTIAKFENMHLVRLDDDLKDKRAKIVTPTANVHMTLGKIHASLGSEMAKMFGKFDATQVQQLSGLLKQLTAQLEQLR